MTVRRRVKKLEQEHARRLTAAIRAQLDRLGWSEDDVNRALSRMPGGTLERRGRALCGLPEDLFVAAHVVPDGVDDWSAAEWLALVRGGEGDAGKE